MSRNEVTLEYRGKHKSLKRRLLGNGMAVAVGQAVVADAL